MEVHIYSIKAKSQGGNSEIMSIQKRPKLNENQLCILKIYAFCQKIQQRALVSGEITAGVRYLSMRINPKSCHFPLKVARTLLSGSRKGPVGA